MKLTEYVVKAIKDFLEEHGDSLVKNATEVDYSPELLSHLFLLAELYGLQGIQVEAVKRIGERLDQIHGGEGSIAMVAAASSLVLRDALAKSLEVLLEQANIPVETVRKEVKALLFHIYVMLLYYIDEYINSIGENNRKAKDVNILNYLR